MAGRPVTRIVLSPREERCLRKLAGQARRSRVAIRARIVLLLAAGGTVREVARALGVSEPTVRLWRSRFANSGCTGLLDAPRRGRPREVGEGANQRIARALSRPRPGGQLPWSLRALSQVTGLPVSTLHRICHEQGICWREPENCNPSRGEAQSPPAEGRGDPDPAAGAGYLAGPDSTAKERMSNCAPWPHSRSLARLWLSTNCS